jgi:hypothetical protein
MTTGSRPVRVPHRVPGGIREYVSVIQAVWPSAQVVRSRGLGHRKLRWNEAIIQKVGGFLQP